MIRKDHLAHAVVSCALAVVGAFRFGPWWGFGLAFAVGVAKEVWDWRTGRGTPEWSDMAANIVGLTLAWALLTIWGI